MSVKGEIFVNFLLQNFMTKYGTVSTYSVTFVCQKILACLQCSELVDGDQCNYQESVTLLTLHDSDDDAVLCEDEEDPISIGSSSILSPYEKVKCHKLAGLSMVIMLNLQG